MYAVQRRQVGAVVSPETQRRTVNWAAALVQRAMADFIVPQAAAQRRTEGDRGGTEGQRRPVPFWDHHVAI